MKLYWSSRSPFARKVMIAAHELGLADRIMTERVVVAGDRPNAAVMQFNPLSKIPTLVLEDGTAIHGSAVVVDYLDSIGGRKLIPAAGAERWAALTLQALADGMMEADLRWMEERGRPEAERRLGHLDGMRGKIEAALAQLEATPPSGVHVGTVALGSALAHLDFRFPEAPWRPERPALTAWFDTFSARPSMRATAFVDQF